MLDELRKQLPAYQMIAITRQNFEEIFAVYDSNPDYFLLTDGRKATMESSAEDILEVPPGFGLEQKIYVGILNNGDAIGVLDLILEYPAQRTLWIGLLLVHGDWHGRKIGSGIVAAVLKAAKVVGYTSVQLGVVKNNTKGMAFWQKHGFERLRVKGKIIVLQKLI